MASLQFITSEQNTILGIFLGSINHQKKNNKTNNAPKALETPNNRKGLLAILVLALAVSAIGCTKKSSSQENETPILERWIEVEKEQIINASSKYLKKYYQENPDSLFPSRIQDTWFLKHEGTTYLIEKYQDTWMIVSFDGQYYHSLKLVRKK